MSRQDRIIIIIDDSKPVRESLKEVLSSWGFEKIYLCHDGISGIEQFKKLASDFLPIVFLDFNLPDKDALSIIKEITDFRPLTKIILFTGREKSEDQIKDVISMGIYHFLAKPFRNEELKKIVDTIEAEEYVN